MKPKRSLSPSLVHIERRLRGDAVEIDTTPADAAEKLAEDAPGAIPDAPVRIPDSLKRLIARRTAARRHQFQLAPSAGQVVEVSRIVMPPGKPDSAHGATLPVPLYVLLDGPTERPDFWHGWLVAAETDYASCWDFVVQEDDGPFDPEAGMVQLWNPVQVWAPMIGRVVGELSAARLAAVRAIAGEFVTGRLSEPAPCLPGRLAVRTTLGGMPVVTGSEIGGEEDPRVQYQDLYFFAAEAIREPARLALASSMEPGESVIGRLLRRLADAAAAAGQGLRVVPQMADAMSGGDAAEELVWDGLARIRVLGLDADGSGRARVSATGQLDIDVRLIVDGTLHDRRSARSGGDAAELAWDGGQRIVVTLSVADGRSVELPIAG